MVTIRQPDFSPGFRVRGAILAALRGGPQIAVELTGRLPYPYRLVQTALVALLHSGQVEQVGLRYRLVTQERPEAA